jgi:hypothetical protein
MWRPVLLAALVGALLPTSAGAVSMHLPAAEVAAHTMAGAPCLESTQACASPTTPEIWSRPILTHADAIVYRHEIGHVTDREYLTPAQREQLKGLPGLMGNTADTSAWGMTWYQRAPGAETGTIATMGERFAVVYSICATYRVWPTRPVEWAGGRDMVRIGGTWRPVLRGVYDVHLSRRGFNITCPTIRAMLTADGAPTAS